jgi:hypothetical protein
MTGGRWLAWAIGARAIEWVETDLPRLEDIRWRLTALMAQEAGIMGDIHPRVRTLARDLGAARAAHLSVKHRAEWLDGLARQIQVAFDDYCRGLPPDDREWPIRPHRVPGPREDDTDASAV